MAPINLSLRIAPQLFRTDTSTETASATRKEFWLTWNPMPTTDDYELQIRRRRW